MEPPFTIQISSGATYLRVSQRNGYGVYSRTAPSGSLTWIIAQITAKPIPPSSVSTEYRSEAAAVNALAQWADAPIQPRMLHKLDEPGIRKATTVYTSFHSKKVGPAQLDFSFSSDA